MNTLILAAYAGAGDRFRLLQQLQHRLCSGADFFRPYAFGLRLKHCQPFTHSSGKGDASADARLEECAAKFTRPLRNGVR